MWLFLLGIWTIPALQSDCASRLMAWEQMTAYFSQSGKWLSEGKGSAMTGNGAKFRQKTREGASLVQG
jgi:hypothetical protein